MGTIKSLPYTPWWKRKKFEKIYDEKGFSTIEITTWITHF